MRNISTVVALVAGCLIALPAVALDTAEQIKPAVHAHQFLSKRAYVQPVVAKAEADQPWVGASLVVGQEAKVDQQQILKMHMMSKRAF